MDFVDLTKGVCIILVVMAHIGGAFDQLDKHSMLSSTSLSQEFSSSLTRDYPVSLSER